MVARDIGDESFHRALPQRLAIGTAGRTERRTDLGEGPQALHLLVGEQEILRAGLAPDALPLGLRALDPLEPELRRKVHDVDGTAGEPADEDRAVDRLLLGPVRTGRREIGRRRAALGDRPVLEGAEDVAALAVELAEAAERGETLHRLGDELG